MGIRMKDMVAKIHRTQPHLTKLLKQIGISADQQDFIAVLDYSDSYVRLRVSGSLDIFFRGVFSLDGTGFLEGGHFEYDERVNSVHIVDISLIVDDLGNVDQHYPISEVGKEIGELLERIYQNMQKALTSPTVRILANGVIDNRKDR